MTHRVGIVGGGVGAQHLAGYAELPSMFEVCTVCDLDEARGRALADQYGVAFARELSNVLADPKIEIVDICLPPHLHFRACMDALDAGKKVICEKPLVGSLREVDLLAAKLSETDGFLWPVFQYRFGIGAVQLQTLIDSDFAGRCYAGTLETHWDRPATYYQSGWRGTWAGERGGAVLGHAIHIHDLLTAFLGPIASVRAAIATRVNNIEVEDCAALAIEMENGALVTSSVTLGSAENISRLRFMFEGFTVESDQAPYLPTAKAWRFIARAPVIQEEIDRALASIGPVRSGYAGMLEALGRTLDGERGSQVTLEDGRRSLEFVTAIYASGRSGELIKLPLDRDHPYYGGWLPRGDA